MNNRKGISRTLLDEFNNIDKEPEPVTRKSKEKEKRLEASQNEEESYTPSYPKRDYETRNRNKTQISSGNKNDQESSKSILKPRQENSLGELTKKFISLIKQTEDYCIDLNDAVGELNVQK